MKISIPLMRSVDVLVVGGSVAACNLALKLRAQGKSVFAVTQFSYFGDEITATLDLHTPQSQDEKELFRLPDIRTPHTPIQFKHTIDQRFINAGIDYLYNSFPVNTLVDDSGALCGLVLANRSGFQAVHAKVIIDGTPRQQVARLAGVPFAEFVPGDYPVSLRVVGAAATDGTLTVTRETPDAVDNGNTYPRFRVTKKIHFADNSPLTLADADVKIRRAAFHPDTLLIADLAEMDLPDTVRADFAPDARIPVFTAGRETTTAESVSALLEKVNPGKPVGVKKSSSANSGADYEIVRCDAFFRAAGREVLEFSLEDMGTVSDCDVLVVGGGTGGAPAAIAAARRKAKTICVEEISQLGGISTAGMIGKYWFGNRVGFCREIDRGTASMGAGRETFPLDSGISDIRWKAAWLLREAANAGAAVLFNSLTVAAVVRKSPDAAGRKVVAGAVVATPGGLVTLLARKSVDASGNSDLVAAAGGETHALVADEPAIQGAGVAPLRLGASYMNNDFSFICDSDVVDATRVFTMAHGKFAAQAFDSGTILGTRERRRIVGDIVLQPQDFFANRMYNDTVNLACSNFDTHGYIVHPMFMLKPTEHAPHYAKVPFRAMLPRNLEGVAVTGLSLSAHRDCLPLIRMQPDVHNQGFAAGTAAAMTAAAGRNYREIAIKELQQILVDNEILNPEVLDETDQIGEIAPDDSHYDLARYFLNPEAAKKELRAQFSAQRDLRSAHILAFLGDDLGKDVLAAAVRDTAWDKGWNYRGMGQFGFSVSPLDSQIFALSRIGGDAEVIRRKLGELRYEHEFSHIRAICMALISHPDPQAAGRLTEILSTYGATGYATRTLRDALVANREEWNDTEVRNRQLKELYLAKALAACDASSALAQSVLNAYKNSLNTYYALFAAQ